MSMIGKIIQLSQNIGVSIMESIEITDSHLIKVSQQISTQDIKNAVDQVLNKENGSRLKFYLSSCINCGMCFNACHFCISHNFDPYYSPVGKVKNTLKKIIKKNGEITPIEMAKIAEIAFTECTLCKRCVLYCPMGIDTAYLMSVVRRICCLIGMVPQYIQDTVNSHAAFFNQMWVKDDEWVDTLKWQEEELRGEFPWGEIPIDKVGADFMYSVIAPEPKFSPELIYYMSSIFNIAKVNWTMSSQPGWDNSDMAMYVRDDTISQQLKRSHFEAALKLKCNYIVMCECGHAFRSVYDTINRQLGWKYYPIKVIHAVEFLAYLLKRGKIKIREKIKEPVTIHDPCNISRGRGLHNLLREVVSYLCENIIEMYPNKEHNICCGAGGGVINCGPIYKEKRVKGNKVKAEQLKKTGAKIVIAPCHNCHSGLEDIVQFYELDMKVRFLGEIIYNLMEKPV